MPLRSDPLDTLAIPDGTTVEEHDLVTDGDVIVGGGSTVGFGVRGHTVLGGERVRFGGDIEAEGDCRLDMWSTVDGNVLVGRDATFGDRVHVDGQLLVSGDLDIGDDVEITDGFEANGWIVIRNSMPTIVFLFVYLTHLLRVGNEEEADEIMSGLHTEDRERLVIPRNARVSDEAWEVSTPATVGDDCRLHGNIRAVQLSLGADCNVFGSLRADADIDIGHGTEIHGDVVTPSGTVRLGSGVHVWGDIDAQDVQRHETAVVEGTIRADGTTTLLRTEDAGDDSGDETHQPDTHDGTDDAGSGDETHQPDRDETDASESAGDEVDDEPDVSESDGVEMEATEEVSADEALIDEGSTAVRMTTEQVSQQRERVTAERTGSADAVENSTGVRS